MEKHLKNDLALKVEASDFQNIDTESEDVVYPNSFFVKNKNLLIKIVFDDIKFIAVEGQYCKLNTKKGNFLLQLSLHQFLKKLPKLQFLRTHRNFIVNFKSIEQVYLNDNLIVLDDDQKILLSRKFKGDLIRRCEVLK